MSKIGVTANGIKFDYDIDEQGDIFQIEYENVNGVSEDRFLKFFLFGFTYCFCSS